ncbi:M23 family metallopeptidase [Tamlana sp. I1]|uniref:M23 family metallopeptidase n=1 Tax=Tamlana sp. I1 TaxID=2762061 RepID=UPI00188E6501|nr:M23 family metallopeptidase [Tamlana sp. I1]
MGDLNIKILQKNPATYAERVAQLEKQARTGTGNFTTLVNNGTTDVETKAKNKIKTFETKTKIIIPDDVVTYTVKLDGDYEDTLDKDLGMVKFCFWLQDKDKKDVKLELGVGKAVKTQKASRNAIQIVKKGNKASTGYQSDFLEIKAGENFTKNVADHSYYYAIITVDKEKKEVKLQVKFSKWMDTYKIRVESYLLGDPIKGDGAATTLSRTVQANPELVESYWLNAEGKKILQTGFVQDVYLYLKTLGLNNKELEVNVYDKDYYPTPLEPAIFYGSTPQDDLIVWENNTIKIEDRNTIKQFKVGDKERYENAAADEDGEYKTWYDTAISQDNFFTIIDSTEKNNEDLELYIHFPDWKTLKLPEDNAYANLKLTTKELISNAFFAEIEKEEVQADAPKIKDKKTGDTRLSPKAKVNYYKKIDNGVLGQKVNLVAACANLEGKKVSFQVFDKTGLLGEKDEALHFIYEETPVCRIEAKVTEGFAVAEIKLLKDNTEEGLKKWKNILREDSNSYKTAQLYLKVEAKENVFIVKSKGEFLKDSAFKLEACKWHDPLDAMAYRGWYGVGADKWHPERSEYLPSTIYRGSGKHEGLDLYAPVGTTVYACMDGEVYMNYKSDTYGNTFGIKANYYGNTYYFFYAHLRDPALFNKKMKVKAGDVIGYAGITGNASTQSRKNHLHFEVRNIDTKTGGRLAVLATIPEIEENLDKTPLESTQP